MSKLVSMKLSKAETKAQYEPGAAEKADRPHYPWGLSLTLDQDALKKLGITELPEVGESYLLVAKCDVTSCSSNESEGGTRRSMGLQITDLCLEDSESDAAEAAETLYGEKK